MNKNQTVSKQNYRKNMQKEQEHKLEIPLPPPLQPTTHKKKRASSAVKTERGPKATKTGHHVRQIEITLLRL